MISKLATTATATDLVKYTGGKQELQMGDSEGYNIWIFVIGLVISVSMLAWILGCLCGAWMMRAKPRSTSSVKSQTEPLVGNPKFDGDFVYQSKIGGKVVHLDRYKCGHLIHLADKDVAQTPVCKDCRKKNL